MVHQTVTQKKSVGSLYIVATPMGNRQDITLRAIEVLKTVDLIAAEDTRHSAPLLQFLGIRTPLFSLHEHNERELAEKLIARLLEGEAIALISDAGTPLISDPGYHLVCHAREKGVKVVPIPGACAAIAALCAAGLPTDRFVFEGFLPAKSQSRQQRLKELQYESRTLIFYESPHRIGDLLSDMEKVVGGKRWVVIARELTKLFETIHAGEIAEVIAWMEADANQRRGEFVVMLAGAEPMVESQEAMSIDATPGLLLDELPVKKAVEITAKLTGKRKNEIYQRALQLKNK